MLKIKAPAKINLTLEVLGKRPDGYHEIRSVIQTVNFCDSFQFVQGDGIQINCDMAGWLPEQSLIAKAVKLLQEATGCNKGATVEIKKSIPLLSGLGGDSSDAAAALYGLNQLWKLELSQTKLMEMGSQLGSDVPFFFMGGTALMEGRGEQITPLHPLPHQWVILIIPGIPMLPGKTKRAYSLLQPSHYTDGKNTEKLITHLKSGKGFSAAALFNTFENVSFSRSGELTEYRDHILKIGAQDIHLAGSGPTMFTMLEEKSRAEDLLIRLKNQGMEVYLTETCNSLYPVS